MVLGDRSPVRWTTATMSYSGIWKGVCGMTWIASRQSSGMCSASAISWVGKMRWSLRTWQHTSTPSSWKRWSMVVKRAGWVLEAAWACLPGEYDGLVVMASDELASSTCFDRERRSWSWTTIWNPSPWPTWCVGRKVLGIWFHLYVMRHSACLQCLPAVSCLDQLISTDNFRQWTGHRIHLEGVGSTWQDSDHGSNTWHVQRLRDNHVVYYKRMSCKSRGIRLYNDHIEPVIVVDLVYPQGLNLCFPSPLEVQSIAECEVQSIYEWCDDQCTMCVQQGQSHCHEDWALVLLTCWLSSWQMPATLGDRAHPFVHPQCHLHPAVVRPDVQWGFHVRAWLWQWLAGCIQLVHLLQCQTVGAVWFFLFPWRAHGVLLCRSRWGEGRILAMTAECH